VLYLENAGRLGEDDAAGARWRRALLDHPGIAILSTAGPASARASSGTERALGLVPVAVPLPDAEERQAAWANRLREGDVDLPGPELAELADRFRLGGDDVAEITAAARVMAAMRPGTGRPDLRDLLQATRERSAWDARAVARRVAPRRQWEDLVVPADTLAQLRELCGRARQSRRVLRDWGFERRLALRGGATALFTGPSGTGKTMAAEVIAGALGLDLYKVDLSGVVSKWIGETEKNLDRIFRVAEGGNGVLFFDEADALFGKRSEVRDSHDRYANVEVSYLLQRMEEHEGVAILATNLRANLDEAFLRRLSFVVHFPFPGEAGRQRIWERVWPDDVPRQDLDLPRLARELPLTGGNIRNVAVAAAYLAADEGGPVRMEHVRRAVRREMQKMGKPDSAAGAALLQ
jgi:SpoVK/Ycf46/Vps4 family AAA+-type ATPase